MSTMLDTTDFSAKILKKVRYTHDAMVDQIIANPGISEIELGQLFGYSKQWVSRLMCSDAFQARLALRKEEIIDPKLTATVEERMRGVALKSLDIILEKMEATNDPKLALKAFELTSKGMTYGARSPVTNNTFVVALPGKFQDEKDWERRYGPQPAIEAEYTEGE
jgi:hypothetical protein